MCWWFCLSVLFLPSIPRMNCKARAAKRLLLPTTHFPFWDFFPIPPSLVSRYYSTLLKLNAARSSTVSQSVSQASIKNDETCTHVCCVCLFVCCVVTLLLCSRIIGKGVFFLRWLAFGQSSWAGISHQQREVEVLSEAKEVFHSVHSQFPNAYIMTSYSIHDHFQ